MGRFRCFVCVHLRSQECGSAATCRMHACVFVCRFEAPFCCNSARLTRRCAVGRQWTARVEIKNLNSTRSIARAIDFESKRHAALLSAGDAVRRQTLGARPRPPFKPATSATTPVSDAHRKAPLDALAPRRLPQASTCLLARLWSSEIRRWPSTTGSSQNPICHRSCVSSLAQTRRVPPCGS